MKATLTLITALLLAPLAASHAADAPAKRPNVLFIITDQLFADAMSCRMGKAFINTPVMDGLAQKGTLFTRAYSANPLCVPARNSLFTGFYPHQTGITENGDSHARLDPKRFVNLGNYFRRAGYDAAYSGKWHLCYEPKATNTHGFEIITSAAENNYDTRVVDGAVKFLARPHEKPFLLVANRLVNTCVDLLPTMLDIAGLDVPKKLPGRSLAPLARGQPLADWRSCVVVQNNMTQAGKLDGLVPRMEGRMVRTERYKYCVYSRGQQRESLVDLQTGPGEMVNLAADPKHREGLLQHRALLARFGQEHNDLLAAKLPVGTGRDAQNQETSGDDAPAPKAKAIKKGLKTK